MSKKDYIKFARMFRNMYKSEDVLILINETVRIFQSDNPKFDRDRFLNAIETGKGLGK